MITRELGSTGCQVPIIAQGTTGTGPLQSACPDKDSRRISVLQKGIELGLNWLDTAELYGGGHSELLVGEAIKGRRSEVFVSSKFNPANSDSAALRKALEGSLKRLKTDYIDLYQIHWPSIAVPAEETLGVLGDFVREGKVRYIGVCNVTIDELKHIHATCPTMASVQMELSPVERSVEQDVLKFCMDNQITLIGYSALSFCNWFRERFIDRVQSIMSAYEITFHQLIVEWLTKKPNVTLALKAAREANLLANAAVSLQL